MDIQDQNFDRLTKRREHVLMTLRYLDRQYEQVKHNTEWLDQAAQQNRTVLLDRLNEWYVVELRQIDRALERIRTQTYGTCGACHVAIDVQRLAAAPEVEYCRDCANLREALQQSEP